MKKLALHIKPLAVLLTFLIVFTITGKSIHVLFSDCDHTIATSQQEHQENGDFIDIAEELVDCEWCKFVPQTPTLVEAPSLEYSIISPIITTSGFVYLSHYAQTHDPSSQFRGPPTSI